MLQAINDRIKGWLGIVIVVLIGLPFALWGIQSYLDDSGPKYAAKVNDAEISANEFERSVSLQRKVLAQQYGGSIPFEDKVLRERTLSQLVNQRLLEGVTYDRGYRITDPIVAAKIKQQFSKDGVFDRVRFEASVASLGMNIPMYESALRNELRVDQMQAGIMNSAIVTNSESQALAALIEQNRDITVLSFNVEHFSTTEKPSEEEVKQYYETNRQQFMVPEKVKVDYVEITSDSLSENIKVDEAQIQKMYDDYVNSISGREERKASHILIPLDDDKAAAKARIDALKEQLDNGADFAELAKENSQDPVSAKEGGELGWVALGEMAKPFEDALFSLELAEGGKSVVSDVVETQFGYHLIRLEGVRSETAEPLNVKRYTFEEELKEEEAASLFYDLSERLASIAYENPDNLDLVVEELGLEVKTSDSFSRTGGEGLFADEKVRSIAFSPLVLEQGSNSDIIEISPTHVMVLRLNTHRPAIAIPMDVVRSRIENILIQQKGTAKARAAALEIKQKIEAGEDAGSFESDGIKLETFSKLSRQDTSRVSDPSILQSAFELQLDQSGKPAAKVIELADGGIDLLVLTKINIPEKVSPEKMELVKNSVSRERANIDFDSTLSAIKDAADVDINKRILE